MDTVRPFFPRRPPAMGKVLVQVTVTNHRDPTCRKRFSALVDTGSTGLVLPLAWKPEPGALESMATVDLETADQRGLGAHAWSPVWSRIAGYPRMPHEAICLDRASLPPH